MHYFSGKGCSESLESMHYCIGILTLGIFFCELYLFIISKYILLSSSIPICFLVKYINLFTLLIIVLPYHTHQNQIVRTFYLLDNHTYVQTLRFQVWALEEQHLLHTELCSIHPYAKRYNYEPME